jgi:hypothetical protein
MRTQITPSLVLSIIALVLSLTGVGYAATQLPRNSVGTPQLKADAVDGAKVDDGSLGAADFSATALKQLKGAKGAKGETGDTGAPGPAGPPGQAGSSGSGGSGGLAVTDASGVVAGHLVSKVQGSLAVTIESAGGHLAEYTNGTLSTLVLQPLSVVVSLSADCAPPLYTLGNGHYVHNEVYAEWFGSASTFTVSQVFVSPEPASHVFVMSDTGCADERPADSWSPSPSFVRLDPVTAIPSLALPLTIG